MHHEETDQYQSTCNNSLKTLVETQLACKNNLIGIEDLDLKIVENGSNIDAELKSSRIQDIQCNGINESDCKDNNTKMKQSEKNTLIVRPRVMFAENSLKSDVELSQIQDTQCDGINENDCNENNTKMKQLETNNKVVRPRGRPRKSQDIQCNGINESDCKDNNTKMKQSEKNTLIVGPRVMFAENSLKSNVELSQIQDTQSDGINENDCNENNTKMKQLETNNKVVRPRGRPRKSKRVVVDNNNLECDVDINSSNSNLESNICNEGDLSKVGNQHDTVVSSEPMVTRRSRKRKQLGYGQEYVSGTSVKKRKENKNNRDEISDLPAEYLDNPEIANILTFMKPPNLVMDNYTEFSQSRIQVTCARCGEQMQLGHYVRMHCIKHYYLCWLEGETSPVDMTDLKELTKFFNIRTKKNAIFKKNIRFHCEKCNCKRKSVYGYVHHIHSCFNGQKMKAAGRPKRSSIREAQIEYNIFNDDSDVIYSEQCNSIVGNSFKLILEDVNEEEELSQLRIDYKSQVSKARDAVMFLKNPEVMFGADTDFKSKDVVECGRCGLKMTLGFYNRVHRLTHYYLSWLKNEEPMDLDNTDNIIHYLKSAVHTKAQEIRAVKFVCEDCQIINRTPQGYVNHKKVCRPADVCYFCKKSLEGINRVYHLKQHMSIFNNMTVVNNGTVKEYICKFCSYTGTDDLAMLAHTERCFKTLNKIASNKDLVEKNISLFEDDCMAPRQLPLRSIRSNDKSSGSTITSIEENKIKPRFTAVTVTDEESIHAEMTPIWYKDWKMKSMLVCIRLNCRYSCSKLNTMSVHFKKCQLPIIKYTCNTCKYVAFKEIEMMTHLKRCGITRVRGTNFKNADCVEFDDISDNYDDDNDSNKGDGTEVSSKEVDEEEEGYKNEGKGSDKKQNRRRKPKDDNYTPDTDISSTDYDDDYDDEKFKGPRNKTTRTDRLSHSACHFDPLPRKTSFEATFERQSDIYSKDPLFPQIRVDLTMFEFLNEETVQKYLPYYRESAKLNFSMNNSFEHMNLFTSNVIESKRLVCYAGGPVWSMAWTPLATVESPSQYLAVACHPHMEWNFDIFKRYQFPSIIQLWSLTDMNNCSVTPPRSPEFSLGIAHNFGAVWSMKWCPSGGFDSSSALPRLGILATATSSGVIPVFAVPVPSNLPEKTSRYLIADLKPTYVLKVAEEEDLQCTRIEWQQCAPHSKIVGGFSNGIVAIWEIGKISRLTRSEKSDNVVYPIHKFRAHLGIITALSLHWVDKIRYLVTGSIDHTVKYWDLGNTSYAPYHKVKKKHPVCNAEWLPHSYGAVSVYDMLSRGTVPAVITLAGNLYTKNKSMHASRFTIWDKSSSPWFNAVALCSASGNVFIADYKYSHKLLQVIPTVKHSVTGIKLVPLKVDAGQRPIINKMHRLTTFLDSSYDRLTDHYGLKFWFNTQKSEEDCNQYIEDSQLTSANRICWNPNLSSFKWLAVGYQCGIVQFIKINRYNNKIKEFYSTVTNMECPKKLNENNYIPDKTEDENSKDVEKDNLEEIKMVHSEENEVISIEGSAMGNAKKSETKNNLDNQIEKSEQNETENHEEIEIENSEEVTSENLDKTNTENSEIIQVRKPDDYTETSANNSIEEVY